MAGNHERPPEGRESGKGDPSAPGGADTDRARDLPDDRKQSSDTNGPGAPGAQAPEPGSVLDGTTNTIENTTPSS